MYNNLDLSSLSIDDIVEEYKLLHERHQQLKERTEEDAQRIHELKRSLDTALAAEKYLTQELEHLSVQPQSTCNGAEQRLQQELEDLRRQYRNLQADHETLQLENDAKDEETRKLQAKLDSAVRDLDAQAALKASSSHDECTVRLTTVEAENAELMQKLAEYEDARVQNTFAVAEQEVKQENITQWVTKVFFFLHSELLKYSKIKLAAWRKICVVNGMSWRRRCSCWKAHRNNWWKQMRKLRSSAAHRSKVVGII